MGRVAHAKSSDPATPPKFETCTGAGILTEKISGPVVSPGGGMVTGQIDTCITSEI